MAEIMMRIGFGIANFGVLIAMIGAMIGRDPNIRSRTGVMTGFKIYLAGGVIFTLAWVMSLIT